MRPGARLPHKKHALAVVYFTCRLLADHDMLLKLFVVLCEIGLFLIHEDA